MKKVSPQPLRKLVRAITAVDNTEIVYWFWMYFGVVIMAAKTTFDLYYG